MMLQLRSRKEENRKKAPRNSNTPFSLRHIQASKPPKIPLQPHSSPPTLPVSSTSHYTPTPLSSCPLALPTNRRPSSFSTPHHSSHYATHSNPPLPTKPNQIRIQHHRQCGVTDHQYRKWPNSDKAANLPEGGDKTVQHDHCYGAGGAEEVGEAEFGEGLAQGFWEGELAACFFVGAAWSERGEG